ncbi:PAS domain-containing sensor histidine kinase [Nocardioides astragali]|uniref:histidine kinase n=1 Tax=Nocardioides astragali TaxID=1776736 RepID=A0ABW2N8D9_9ACTN|nr:histidine kinase [Nocardioides astragali]
MVDGEDRLVYASEPWPLEEVQVGAPIFDLVPAEFVGPYREALHQARTTGETQAITARGPRPEHGPDAMGWFRAFYFPIRDDLMGGFGVDITEMVEAREALSASRARLVAAGDQARRRIERDLHDGVQQQLITQLMSLRLVSGLVFSDPARAVEMVEDLIRDVEETVDVVRDVARGIHPAALTQFGLVAALQSLAARSTLEVALRCEVDRRLPEAVEIGAYFLCAESLTNVAKYAGTCRCSVSTTLAEDTLRVEISDEGVGGAEVTRGGGLEGIRDRIEALHGELLVSEASPHGTRIVATIPLAAGMTAPES